MSLGYFQIVPSILNSPQKMQKFMESQYVEQYLSEMWFASKPSSKYVNPNYSIEDHRIFFWR